MEIGTVRLVDIDKEMRGAYLDYAMSVITARALPDVRDGLKPVQRRILYAMNELGITHAAAYKKSARIVGEVLGKYHPHGDVAVYETMVRMAQDFSLRYMLIDGQGNFGSVDGDPPAAMRYTEARLAAIAEEILLDLDKNTVDFVDNFDATLKEPSVLPARLPNLLVNGASGIAVGMATNIPPHNLTEVADAIIFVLDRFQETVDGGIPFDIAQARVHNRPVDRQAILDLRKRLSTEFKERLAQECERKTAEMERAPRGKEQRDDLEHGALLDVIDQAVDAPAERLMELVLGPDFPTGGIIVGRKGIVDAYTTGHGRIVIRAKAFVEERGGDKSTIIITELPYQVNKATLVERIADLVRDKRIEGVAELRDESDRQGMRIVLELRRDVQARQLLNNLYKLTAMQSAFSVNLLALVDGEPRVLTLKRLLQHHIDYRHQVITRRTQFELDKARARAHILEGLKIALDNLDEVITTIRNSPDAETARPRLMKRFKLSDLQAQAILDMQLRRLAALERKKIEQELADTLKLIGQLEDLLAHPIKMYGLIKQDLLELKQKYGDERRTKVREEEAEDFTAEDLIPDEDVVVAVSAKSYVKRVAADSYRAQSRRTGAPRPATALASKEQDPAVLLVQANTHDTIIFVSSLGKAYALKCHEIPDADRQARGVPLSNFLSLANGDERIVGMIASREQNGDSVTLVTRHGEIKRVLLSELAGIRASGIGVMGIEKTDEVVWAAATAPGQEIIVVTGQAKSIRFEAESEVRASGRGSGGVRAIKLDADDRVIAVDLVDKEGALVTLSALGMGKRTALSEYSAQGRAGGGIMTATLTDRSGPLAAARVLTPGDDALIVSATGSVVRRPFDEIAAQQRAGRGARLIEMEKGDRPVAILRLRPDKKSPPPSVGPEPAQAPAPPKKARAAAAKETAPEEKAKPIKTASVQPSAPVAGTEKKTAAAKKPAKAPTVPRSATPLEGKEKKPTAKPAKAVVEKAPAPVRTAKPAIGRTAAAATTPRAIAPAVKKAASGTVKPPVATTKPATAKTVEPPVKAAKKAAQPEAKPKRPAKKAEQPEAKPKRPAKKAEQPEVKPERPTRKAKQPEVERQTAPKPAPATAGGVPKREHDDVSPAARLAQSPPASGEPTPSRVPPPSPVRTRGQASAPEAAPPPASPGPSAGAPPQAELTPSRVPPPSPVRSAATGQKTTRRAPAKQPGPEDIVFRAHGQRTIISRDESDEKPAGAPAGKAAKKGKAKPQPQLSLPIWGEERKKK